MCRRARAACSPVHPASLLTCHPPVPPHCSIPPPQLLALLKSSAPYVRSEADWRTVCALLRLTSVRPEASALAYESLSVAIGTPGTLTGASYLPLLEACLQYLQQYKEVRDACVEGGVPPLPACRAPQMAALVLAGGHGGCSAALSIDRPPPPALLCPPACRSRATWMPLSSTWTS